VIEKSPPGSISDGLSFPVQLIENQTLTDRQNRQLSFQLIENRQLIENQTTDRKTDNRLKNRQLIEKQTTDRKTDN